MQEEAVFRKAYGICHLKDACAQPVGIIHHITAAINSSFN
jgi:hypothetical protein